MSDPIVGIIMGSHSDLDVMLPAEEVLKLFGVPYEMQVISAHRTPDRALEYARSARKRGLKAIIAGAGGAAHLPGVLAALTTLPVIGVPVMTKALGGVDSLYSIVQMPSGIPVATVGINNAKNAGLLAVRMLAMTDPKLAAKLDEFQETMRQGVMEKNAEIERRG